jgi:hypothetical protein
MNLSTGCFHSIFYLLLATFSTLVVRSESCDCPISPGSIEVTETGETTFSVPAAKGLCTLVQISPDGQSFKPVARSYAGRPWEACSGEFASLKWTCTGTLCAVNLPALNDGAKYQLTTFATPTSSAVRRNEIARFLEQATFGPTRSEITKLNGTANLQQAFAAWIKEHQSKVPLTSHRATFRQRVNAKMETATHVGAVTHPCQKGSVYRRYAFSSKDLGKYMDIETVGTKRIIKVDGFVRTVVEGSIYQFWNPSVVWPDGRYVSQSCMHILLSPHKSSPLCTLSSQLTLCLPKIPIL